ncbi:MAG: glucose-6-phosphate isomerase family protein [Balneolaceae bacterium]
MHLSTAQQIIFDLNDTDIDGAERVERRLSDLKGFFANEQAFEAALAKEDSILYTVQSVTPADGEGDLHYGLGTLMPGKIGDEYYLTKGHLHSWREAAEVYIGLEGEGLMLLEDEKTGDSKIFPLKKNSIVYVPGYVAHRTVNTGETPLKYLGIYPAAAGHDYGVIAERNFLSVIADVDGKPTEIKREDYLKNIK